MQFDSPDDNSNDNERPQPRKATRAPKPRGGHYVLTASICALSWSAAVGAGAYFGLGAAAFAHPVFTTLFPIAAGAFAPSIAFLFAGFAARESARARGEAAQIVALAARNVSGKDAVAAVQASRALKNEVTALDQVLREANQRFAHFHGALATDGAALGEVLTRDIQAMRALRAEIRCEADAITASVGRHVKNLHDAASHLKTETVGVHRLLDEQMGAFGKAFANIGARSAEFAAAASTTTASAETFDAAVAQALEALAHATSLNESARQSCMHSAEAANGAARAVRASTLQAVNDVRQAARLIRVEGGQAVVDESAFEGVPARANIAPPTKLSHVFDLLRLKPHIPPSPANDAAPTQQKPVSAPIAAQPTPRREANLADLTRLAGVRAGEALTVADLSYIARASEGGVNARRQAVRDAAGEPVKQLSTYLRRNRDTRRAAEMLRSNPSRALRAGIGPDNGRALTSAYLLVDAALG
jgi:hypothetical protein